MVCICARNVKIHFLCHKDNTNIQSCQFYLYYSLNFFYSTTGIWYAHNTENEIFTKKNKYEKYFGQINGVAVISPAYYEVFIYFFFEEQRNFSISNTYYTHSLHIFRSI